LRQPLDEINHPLIAKTNEQFAGPATSRTRIAAVDDNVLFKVKVNRHRGAVWVQADPQLPWLVAGGWRESGSDDDFYEALAAGAQKARVRYNSSHKPALTTKTYTMPLLPDADDHDRYEAETSIRQMRALRPIVNKLVRESLCDGHEHAVTLETFALGIQVRAEHGHETYVAIRITGSVPNNIAFTILDLVPGCVFENWMPEFDLPALEETLELLSTPGTLDQIRDAEADISTGNTSGADELRQLLAQRAERESRP
jgi:hypothetical protein